MKAVLLLSVIAVMLAPIELAAQQRYELIVPNKDLLSRAERTDEQLVIIDQKGVETRYERARRFDTADGEYVGYYSAAAKQIIRWPASDRGTLLIATDRGGTLTFRSSLMEIHPIVDQAAPVRPLELDANAPYRIAPFGPQNRTMAVGINAAERMALVPIAVSESQLWHFTPLGNGYYRIHSDMHGRHRSLAGMPDGSLVMDETGNSLNQFWHFAPVWKAPGFFVLANATAAVNPPSLTILAGGALGLEKCMWSDSQLWQFVPVEAPLPPVFDEYRFRSREIRPKQDLAAAELEFLNSHDKEIWVAIADRLAPGSSRQLKIAPGEISVVSLERDPGGMLVEVYERVLPGGFIEREEFVTDLPPATRYDVSVYEVIVQSIAIDATVKGGRVEDVQYAPKSVGWFELAAGPALEDGVIDAYAVAKSQRNPGMVRRIDPSEWNPKPAAKDPVESLLEKYQKKGER